MRRLVLICLLPLAACMGRGPIEPEAASGPSPQARGRALAQENCGGCHAIGETGASPVAKAPPFRDLHKKYPVENLQEALAEGIVAHPEMPEFKLTPEQVNELIGYMKMLEPPAKQRRSR